MKSELTVWYKMLLMVAVLHSIPTNCYGQNIKLKDNGYEGILLAISDNVPYNESLIPRIKEVFNKASATLYSATKHRAYFREVTILLPSNWSVPAINARTETFLKANIRVDLPSSGKGSNPWVSQPAGCGEPGEFMHLTPEFLLDEAISQRYGLSEKVIVHEWGHLRWGLFDEYPASQDISDQFYLSPKTEKLEATRCNLKIEGMLRNKRTRAACKIDPHTSLPEEDCMFYPSKTQKSGQSSFMYYQQLPQVMEFCDDNELSPDTLHNIEAPNRQNKLCNRKSSWEVMRESVDFNNGENPSRDDSTLNTTVTFRVIKRRDPQKIVVVMDVSGSMSSNNLINKMASAVKHFLKYTVPTSSWVGLVKYSDIAYRVTQSLVQITGENTRDDLVNKVPISASGYTAIGQGLQVAHEMMREHADAVFPREVVAGYRIVLLTDGQQNRPPSVEEVTPTLANAGIAVDTILLTPAADNALISLAADTGGLSFYSSGSDTSNSLMDAYTEAERSRSSNPLTTPITIISRVLTVTSALSCFGVYIDKSLGTDTTFTFNWMNNGQINIKIMSPKNMTKHDSNINGNSFGYKNNNSDEVGLWNVCVKNLDNSNLFVTMQVESTAQKNSQSEMPITVRTMITNKDPSFNESKPVTITATVSKGYTPVIAAKVTAYIESPQVTSSSKPVELELRDDGSSADIEKDDGVYSAYLLNTASTGKHTVTVTVIGTNDTKTKDNIISSKAGIITEPGYLLDEEKITLTPTDEFERFSLAGFIGVKAIADLSVDTYAPSRIQDFTVIESSYETERITFEWSAVGDDLDVGNASYYEIWYADDFKSLLKSYSNTTKLNVSEILEGNLSQPLPPYSRERLTIKAKNKDKALVYAIIAFDEAGNPSLISNIVPVKLLLPAPVIDATTEKPSSQVGAIVGPTLGLLVFAIIVTAY